MTHHTQYSHILVFKQHHICLLPKTFFPHQHFPIQTTSQSMRPTTFSLPLCVEDSSNQTPFFQSQHPNVGEKIKPPCGNAKRASKRRISSPILIAFLPNATMVLDHVWLLYMYYTHFIRKLVMANFKLRRPPFDVCRRHGGFCVTTLGGGWKGVGGRLREGWGSKDPL